MYWFCHRVGDRTENFDNFLAINGDYLDEIHEILVLQRNARHKASVYHNTAMTGNGERKGQAVQEGYVFLVHFM